MDDGSGRLIRDENLEAATVQETFAANDRIRVVGLNNHPKLNGQDGCIVAWSDVHSRWKVLMDDGSKNLLLGTNLAPQPLPEYVPATLIVHVAEGDEAHRKCSGVYTLTDNQWKGGQPLSWQHAEEELWLYIGDDGLWYIGGREAPQKNFRCAEGRIRSSPEYADHPDGDRLPHEIDQGER